MNWVSKRSDTTNRINTTVGEIICNGIYVKNPNPSANLCLTRDICALLHKKAVKFCKCHCLHFLIMEKLRAFRLSGGSTC